MIDPWVAEKYDLVAEINMIPLIDVSLVLLIIFMVLTPVLVRSQIAVNLPQAETAEVPSTTESVILVQIDRSGAVTIDGQPVAAADLQVAFEAVLQGRSDLQVVLQADRDVAFQYVVGVMDAAKKGGASRMGVAALSK